MMLQRRYACFWEWKFALVRALVFDKADGSIHSSRRYLEGSRLIFGVQQWIICFRSAVQPQMYIYLVDTLPGCPLDRDEAKQFALQGFQISEAHYWTHVAFILISTVYYRCSCQGSPEISSSARDLLRYSQLILMYIFAPNLPLKPRPSQYAF